MFFLLTQLIFLLIPTLFPLSIKRYMLISDTSSTLTPAFLITESHFNSVLQGSKLQDNYKDLKNSTIGKYF